VRALYLQPASSFGGAERQAAQCIRLLPHHGVEVVPFIGPGREIVEFLEDAGVSEYIFRGDLPHDGKAPRDLARRAALLAEYVRAYLRFTRDVAMEAARHRCHLLFASRPFAWVVAGMAGRQLGLPVVWRAGTHFEHWTQPLLLERFAAWRPPRAVVYTSEAVERGLSAAVRAPGFVVHNGVDPVRFDARRGVRGMRGELSLHRSTPVVGFVARIAPEKGIDLLLEVTRRLIGLTPGVRLIIAGDSGWRPALQRRFAEEGLASAVRLLGFVREIERVYATCDVVISTSTAEGCPNALLEAMAMGRPVVATRVGGTEEIVRDGIDGLLAVPGDAAGLARAVAELLVSPDRRAAIGAAAAARVRERFSVAVQVGKLAAILQWAAGFPAPARAGERVAWEID
jgi:glycosyltransferase involved in cell wall biosynthesis